MKKSSIAHGFSIVAGIVGSLALVGAWLGQNLYNDAIALLLISIASAVCAQIYLTQNK